MRRTALLALTALAATSCARKPVTAPRAVVPETSPRHLTASATAAERFGHMVALGVGVANGSARDYLIQADRILAVDGSGNRIAPLAVAEAARQAGGATALVAGLRGAGGGALLTGLLGAMAGAAVGAVTGGPAEGAAVGGGIGAVAGAVGGYYEAKSATEREIVAQLGGLYLGRQISKPGLPVSGFVFFPEGEYVGVKVYAVEEPGALVEEVFGPMVDIQG